MPPPSSHGRSPRTGASAWARSDVKVQLTAMRRMLHNNRFCDDRRPYAHTCYWLKPRRRLFRLADSARPALSDLSVAAEGKRQRAAVELSVTSPTEPKRGRYRSRLSRLKDWYGLFMSGIAEDFHIDFCSAWASILPGINLPFARHHDSKRSQRMQEANGRGVLCDDLGKAAIRHRALVQVRTDQVHASGL